MHEMETVRAVRSSRAFTVGALCLCLLTYTMFYGFLIPVLPTALVDRISISEGKIQFWISILLALEAAATLVVSPLVGYVTDFLRSRRLALLVGLVLLGAAMAIIGASRSIQGVLTGRIIQGAASAVIQVISNAVILDCAPNDAVGQYLGYAGAASNLGFLAGPLLGGAVYQYLHWDGLFAIVGGIVLVNLTVPLVMLPSKDHSQTRQQETPDAPPTTEGSLGQQGAAGSRWRSLMTRKMYLEIWASFVTGIFISAIDSVVAVFVEEQFHWNSLGRGLVFLPVAIPALLEPIYGWFADTYGPLLVGTVGFVTLIPVTICLRLVTSNTLSSKVVLCTLLGCIGTALDLTDPAGYLLIDDVLEQSLRASSDAGGWKDMASRAFGIQHGAQYLGITVGPFIVLALPAVGRLGALGLLLGCLSAATVVVWAWGARRQGDESAWRGADITMTEVE